MAESWRTRLMRWGFNFFPAYRGTGGRLTYIADDFREIHVRLKLRRKTRNYVGTLFGGSLYGAVDPIYMVMFIRLLGPDYVVWDKSATIRFRRPGTTTVYARFVVTPDELDAIRAALATEPRIDRSYRCDLATADGEVCAEVEKVLHFSRKRRPAVAGDSR